MSVIISLPDIRLARSGAGLVTYVNTVSMN